MARLTSELFVRLMDGVTRPAQGIARAFNGIGQSVNRLNGAGSFGQNLANAAARANTSMDAMRGRMFDAVAMGYALTRAIQSPIQAAMEFESAMADVRKVVDFPTPEAFVAFKNDLLEMSKALPVSVNGLAQIAAAAGQAGIAGEDLLKFTDAAAKVGVAFDISADQAGDALAKLMTGLGITIDEAVSLSDAMNHLSNQQASSAAEILDVVRRVGAQAQLYGYTAEQTAAFASAMISAGAESEVAATSFRNMGMALTRGASATKRQKDAFKDLGLNATDVAKRMQEDAVGTTIEVLELISQLPKELQGAVASDLFGNEARALGPLLTNLDLVRDSMDMVAEESVYAGSAFREFEVRAGTFENSLQLFNNQLTAMKVVIGEAIIPALSDLMTRLEPVIEGVTQFARENPELTRSLVTATAAIIGFRIALTALKWAGLFSAASALGGLSKAFFVLGGAAKAAKSAIALQTALAAGANYSGLAKFGTALGAIVRAVPGVGLLASGLSAIGTAAAAISAPVWGTFALVAAAIGAAGVLVWKYWDRLTSIFSGIAAVVGETLSPAFDMLKPAVAWMAPIGDSIGTAWGGALTKLQEFGNWIAGFFQREVLTEEEKAAFAQSGREWAQGMVDGAKAVIMELVEWFKGLPQMILNAIGSIDIGSLIQWPQMPWDSGPPAAANQNAPAGADVPQMARGGSIKKGTTAIVGDGGEPEFFTAGADGYITPFSEAGSGGSGNGRPGPAQAPVFAPKLVIEGNVYGVDDLEARFDKFAARMQSEFAAKMAGGFADTETA